MIDPDPDPHPHPDPRFPDTHKNINSPSPIMIKQVKTKQLNLQSPLYQRIVKMATGVYKAIHGYKVPRRIGELLHERSTNYNLRGKHTLDLPKVNTTTYGLKSRRYTAAKIWNALPDQFRAANNIGTFKNLMSKLDFSNFTF